MSTEEAPDCSRPWITDPSNCNGIWGDLVSGLAPHSRTHLPAPALSPHTSFGMLCGPSVLHSLPLNRKTLVLKIGCVLESPGALLKLPVPGHMAGLSWSLPLTSGSENSQARCSRGDSSKEDTGRQLMPCFLLPDVKTGDEDGERSTGQGTKRKKTILFFAPAMRQVSHTYFC